VAVASAGPYASLHLAPDNHTNTLSLSFYRLDALPAAQPRYEGRTVQYQSDPGIWSCFLIFFLFFKVFLVGLATGRAVVFYE